MSAIEMFEKLGYEYYEDEFFIQYREITKQSIKYKIVFCKFEKCIELIPTRNGKEHHFTRLDMKLLKAINQQCKELGWD